MTALTLVMGFYELSARDKRVIENLMPSRPPGTIDKSPGQARFVRRRGFTSAHPLLRPSGTIHS
jgi:hypothetical protein